MEWNLTKLRQSKGISSAKLAALIGVTPATVWHWEQRPAVELRPKQLKQLEAAFTQDEIDSLFHPEKYLDDNGRWIAQSPVPQSEPEQLQIEIEETVLDPELVRAAREVLAVATVLSVEGRQRLVQFADFLYHSENGMVMPGIGGTVDVQEILKAIQEK